MNSVKIYTAVSEDLSPLIQGEWFCTDMVRYSDYAALEAKCDELAAEKEKFAVECAATKIAIAYLKSGQHDFTLNTPATDAFLAEVRAQGLNAFIQHHSAELDAHIKNGGEQFDEKSVRIRDIIVSARLFREQIRKGVQS